MLRISHWSRRIGLGLVARLWWLDSGFVHCEFPHNLYGILNGVDGAMHIRLDDLSGPQVQALLEEHLRDMNRLSPPESVHALDLDALRKPEIAFWTAWSGDALLGCGALKQLTALHGEIVHAHCVCSPKEGVAGRSRISLRRRGDVPVCQIEPETGASAGRTGSAACMGASALAIAHRSRTTSKTPTVFT